MGYRLTQIRLKGVRILGCSVDQEREVRMKFFLGLFIMVFTLFPHAREAIAVKGDLEKGKAHYVQHCMGCHGTEGKGDGYTLFNPPVADLTSAEIQKKSDYELWRSVHEGVSNTAMGTWKWALTDEETAHVLAYVQTLAR